MSIYNKICITVFSEYIKNVSVNTNINNDNVRENLINVNKICLNENIKYIEQNIDFFQDKNDKYKNDTNNNIISKNILNALLESNASIKYPAYITKIVDDIVNNKLFMEEYKSNPSALLSKLSNDNFIDMIYNKIINIEKYQKNDKINSNDHQERQNITMPLASTPIQPQNYNYNYNHSESNIVTEDTIRVDKPLPLNNTIGNNYIKNVFPNIEDIYLINYILNLDILYDNDSSYGFYTNKYKFLFKNFGNISKIRLISLYIENINKLLKYPYIYIKIENINGKCLLSNGENVFGKIILKDKINDNLLYIPDIDNCLQTFTSPININELIISFLSPDYKYINISEIAVSKIEIVNSKIKISFIEKHKLQSKNIIDLYILNQQYADLYTVSVETIDDNSIFIDNIIDTKINTDNIKIYRKNVNLNMTFNLYELNNYLLTEPNSKTNTELINLSGIIENIKKNRK